MRWEFRPGREGGGIKEAKTPSKAPLFTSAVLAAMLQHLHEQPVFTERGKHALKENKV